jgi:two-component system phosphate regulon response regulator PhoB
MDTQARPNTDSSTAQGHTILIADDEPHIRLLVGNKLRKAGHHVLEASNGQDALALAQEHRPSLIVTDYEMPIMSGFQMSQRLSEDDATAEIPIIMLTARGHKLSVAEIAKTGIRLVMDKPFSPRQLVEQVQEQLH